MFAIQVANTLFTFLSLLLTTRILGPEGRGAFSMYQNSLALLVTWLGISLPSAFTYFIAKKEIETQKIISFTLIFHLVIGVISYLFLSHFDQLYRYLMPFELLGTYWRIILVVHFISLSLTQSLVAVAAGKNRFKTAAWSALVMNFAVCGLWVFLMNSHGYYPLYFIVLHLLLSSFIPMVILILDLWKHQDIQPLKVISINEVSRMIRYTGLAFACNALQFLTYRLDIWILNHYHGHHITGQYSTAVMAAQLLWLLPNTIAMITLPKFAADNKNIELFTRAHKAIVWLSMIGMIVIYLSYQFFYPYVIGSQFQNSLEVLPILLLATWILSPTILTSSFHAGQDLLKYNLWATLAGLFINILLNIWWIPQQNMYGAACATLFSYISIQVVFLILLRKKFHIGLRDLFGFDLDMIKRVFQ